jgi:small subunit ribosomal protein S8
VEIPNSREKEGIARVLQEEGYVKTYKVMEDSKQNVLKVYLKYGPDGEMILNHIERASKPSRRVYKKVHEVEKVLDGIGIGIYSTSKGILSDRKCRHLKVGGEHICTIW